MVLNKFHSLTKQYFFEKIVKNSILSLGPLALFRTLLFIKLSE